ncbi:MAG: hypothetical protein QF437_15915 [Planctomycetota bacterium]|jgi:hypothetical protein|nr:hypothetical protein [Planctomycetota bacterium]MDP7131984.1 hypothetical protein [Planctomycetota bacterium]MDP7253066.1 hypothetical protein [Planctomycetota bacterium]
MSVTFIGLTIFFFVNLQGADLPRPDDLLFEASFDRLTAFADFARGSPDSTLEASLELRAKPGVATARRQREMRIRGKGQPQCEWRHDLVLGEARQLER